MSLEYEPFSEPLQSMSLEYEPSVEPLDVSAKYLLESPIQGYLAHKKDNLLGPYSRTIPRVLWWS